MRIAKLNLSHLRTEEWFNLYADLLEQVPIYGADKLGIADLIALLIDLHNRADKVLIVLRKSVHTAEMEKADKERDAFFRGLLDVVKTSRRLPATADKEAAERLYVLLSGYRKFVLNSGYSEESSALYNLLQDLHEKYAADITLLGLGKWVNNLDLAEQKFLSYRSQRTKEEIDRPVERLDEIRKETDILYRSSMEILYAKLVVSGLGGDVVVDPESLKTDIYEDSIPQEQRGNVAYNFVIAWNHILKKYSNLLAARAGRKAKGKKPEPDEPDESDEPKED
ncbi:MAG: DUF6261 family protein [Tannerellaceae bacterium]|jgi:hypothetical protein|nr:DUF6261 family protein [Tannerellaceae bacterium]